MKVKPLIDKKYTEIEIHVCNEKMNSNVIDLVNGISDFVNTKIIGTDERGEKVMLSAGEIVRFYAENQRVMAQAAEGTYRIQQKLYELEDDLDATQFFRISKSEIVNLRKIRKLDMDIVGTIRVILTDGTETYTSRRKVTNLKKQLGLL